MTTAISDIRVRGVLHKIMASYDKDGNSISDTYAKIENIPTMLSLLENDSGYLNSNDVLEIIQTKVDKIDGYSLISNEDIEKLWYLDKTKDIEKPISIPMQEALDLKANIDNIPTKVSELLNDSNYLTEVPEEYVTTTEMSAFMVGSLSNFYTKNESDSKYILDISMKADNSTVDSHISNVSNPHNVTKVLIGLGNVTDDALVKRTELGVTVATLEDGKVPSSLLPSYVDDVLEYESITLFPEIGESGKIYISTDDNLSYRWTGTLYIEISKSLAIGETSSTAYAGDKGKQLSELLSSEVTRATETELSISTTLSNHTSNISNPHYVTKEQVGLGNVDNTSDINKPISTLTQDALDNKVDKIEGKSLVLDSEIEKLLELNTLSSIDSSISLAKESGDNAQSAIDSHINNITNPHSVTKELIGLANVDNTSDLNKPISTLTLSALNAKVDKVTGKQLSTEDFTTSEKNKLSSIEDNANNYTHPSFHSADIITLDSTHRFVSDVEKSTWNNKAETTLVSTSANGLMSSTDKSKLDNIENNSNNYVHPTTSGNKHIPTGGYTGLILSYLEDGTALWSDSTSILDTKFTELNTRWEELNTIQEKLSLLVLELNNNIDLYSYGVEWDITVSSPVLTRIGNPLLHKSLPIQSAYRGCVSNGTTINYYLYSEDWNYKEDGITPSILDGTDGVVRVHIPKFYGKSGSNGNKRWVRISTILIDDSWVKIPEMLVDAYRCTVEKSTGKAVSVVNSETDYRGGGDRSSYDTYLEEIPYRSDLGKPRTNVSRATMRTYAKNAGSELLCYEYYKWIFYWAYVIEYANFNSQATYNSDLTEDGYRLGGLGPGVTLLSSTTWNIFNGYYPLIPCGFCNDIGNFTGVKELAVSTDITTSLTTSLSSYSKDSAGGTASNSGTSVIISKVAKANSRILYCLWNVQSGSTVYNISGMNSGLSIIFYTNGSVIATATEDGEITVNWGTSQSERLIRASVVESSCSITMKISSASLETITMSLGTLKVPRWRGFDNPFGDIWTNLDGIVIYRPVANEPSNVYTSTSEFTDEIGAKTIAGVEIALDGYIKTFDLGDTGEIIPSSIGGSESTYKCDYHYCNASSTSLRTLRVGGHAADGSKAGLGYFGSYYSVSDSVSDVGFRSLIKIED